MMNSDSARNPLNILLVEDHPDVAELEGACMLDKLGHTVEMAGSVAQAVEAAEKESFGLVIADFRLPDGNANDLAGQLKRRGPVRVILLTAADPMDMAPSAKEAFVCCLQKPVDTKGLGDAIEIGHEGSAAAHAVRGVFFRELWLSGTASAACLHAESAVA